MNRLILTIYRFFERQKAFVESKEEVSLPALQKALEGTDYTIKKD